jgi:hypothetical protein
MQRRNGVVEDLLLVALRLPVGVARGMIEPVAPRLEAAAELEVGVAEGQGTVGA